MERPMAQRKAGKRRVLEPCTLCLQGCTPPARMVVGPPRRWRRRSDGTREQGACQHLWCVGCEATGRRYATPRAVTVYFDRAAASCGVVTPRLPVTRKG